MPETLHPNQSKLEQRVHRAAEAALARQKSVCAIDVLCGMGLLAPSNVDFWRKGRVPFLETWIQGSAQKISSSIEIFWQWAQAKGLKQTEGAYLRPTRTGPVALQFTVAGEAEIERGFRTHFVSPELSEKKQAQVKKKLDKTENPVVFQVVRDTECSECGAEIAKGCFLSKEAEEALCLVCARMGDLEFLPSGDTALTRRATKYSERMAVVVRFSRSRGRYERQGILVERAALEKAEHECVEDADERAAARVRGAERRREQDRELVVQMTRQIAALFPGCPAREAAAIAEHTALRGSGRVGRSEAGRNLEDKPLRSAAIAAIRHNHTDYDELLASGVERAAARQQVADRIDAILAFWEK